MTLDSGILPSGQPGEKEASKVYLSTNEWSAEDLKGEDMEYVEWAGEYQLFSRLNERLEVLESIENVAS